MEKLISVAHIFAQYFSLLGDVKHFLLLSGEEASNNIGERGKEKREETKRKRQIKKGLECRATRPKRARYDAFLSTCGSVYAERETLEVAEKRKYRGEKQFKTLFLLRPPVLWRPYSSVSPLVTGPLFL